VVTSSVCLTTRSTLCILWILSCGIITERLYAQSTTIAGIINHYTPVTAIDGCNHLIVESTEGFGIGDRVLVIQMQGASISTANDQSYGTVVNDSGAGIYEFGRIMQLDGSNVVLEHPLLYTYLIAGNVQLVRVPEYTSVKIASVLTCPAWNGRIGGIVAFTTDTVWLGPGIDVSAKGFRGGHAENQQNALSKYITDYVGPQNYDYYGMKGEGMAGYGAGADIGGKGAPANGGGGGGAGYGCGGNGGWGYKHTRYSGDYKQAQGLGGHPLGTLAGRLVMGGGGGSGHENNGGASDGAPGGGIVIIDAQVIVAETGTLAARGGNAQNSGADGAGGGGGGGMIALSWNYVTGTIPLDVRGGSGGSTGDPKEQHGPGGGGGGGAVAIRQTTNPGNTLQILRNGGTNGKTSGGNPSYGAVSGCDGELLYSSLFPESDLPPVVADAGKSATTCPGSGVQLTATGGSSYQWSPTLGLSCSNCATPIASPETTTTYTVKAFSDGGCWATDTVTVVVVGTQRILQCSIPRETQCRPGDIITIPVMLEETAENFQIRSLEVSIGFSADMMLLRKATTAGTFAQNWSMTDVNQQSNRFSARLTAPPGTFFEGKGVLINFQFQTFLGYAQESELPLTITVIDSACTTVRTQSGHVALSGCGMVNRLLDVSQTNYTLDQNNPNPFNPTTTINFTVGLEGMTTLEVLDVRGDLVTTILNEFLQTGPYTAVWDATNQPSGLYYYRLTSGTWSSVKTMVLVK
jgi:hypothetical protein